MNAKNFIDKEDVSWDIVNISNRSIEPRSRALFAPIGQNEILICGGYADRKFLGDGFVFNTIYNNVTKCF